MLIRIHNTVSIINTYRKKANYLNCFHLDSSLTNLPSLVLKRKKGVWTSSWVLSVFLWHSAITGMSSYCTCSYRLVPNSSCTEQAQIRGSLQYGTVQDNKGVLRIRTLRMFLGPDPLVRGTDPSPDPYIIYQNRKKNLDSYCFVFS
jgi:hypothetical protein